MDLVSGRYQTYNVYRKVVYKEAIWEGHRLCICSSSPACKRGDVPSPIAMARAQEAIGEEREAMFQGFKSMGLVV
jgi:hypothetical protein